MKSYILYEELPEKYKLMFQVGKDAKNERYVKMARTRAKKSYIDFINLLIKNGDEMVSPYTSVHDHIQIKWKKCGHTSTITVGNYMRGYGCAVCTNRQVQIGVNDLMTTHPHLAKMLVNQEEAYKYSAGCPDHVLVRCPLCGSTKMVSIRSFVGYNGMMDCPNKECYNSKSSKLYRIWDDDDYKENHPGWKGGISTISHYLSSLVEVEQCMAKAKHEVGYRCALTSIPGNLASHHLYSFNQIVKDAHIECKINVKKTIVDYTKNDLLALEQYIIDKHKDTSNLVVINVNVHKLFHKLYGYGNNTPEQFEEFKQRYLNGEFNDILEEIFNNK